jgi:CRISPR-associated protein Cas1
MDAIPASDLKTILHSKRANLYYLEHCRVLVKGGRVEYVTDEGKASLYWNIPIANTTCLLPDLAKNHAVRPIGDTWKPS